MSAGNIAQAIIAEGWCYSREYEDCGGALEAAPWIPLSTWKNFQKALSTLNFSLQKDRDAIFEFIRNLDIDAPFSWEGRFPAHGFWVSLRPEHTALLQHLAQAGSFKEKYSEVRELALTVSRGGNNSSVPPPPDREAAYPDKGESSTAYYKSLKGLVISDTWSRKKFEKLNKLEWVRIPGDGAPGGGGGGGRSGGGASGSGTGGRGDSKFGILEDEGRGD